MYEHLHACSSGAEDQKFVILRCLRGTEQRHRPNLGRVDPHRHCSSGRPIGDSVVKYNEVTGSIKIQHPAGVVVHSQVLQVIDTDPGACIGVGRGNQFAEVGDDVAVQVEGFQVGGKAQPLEVLNTKIGCLQVGQQCHHA